ncbi:MAP/microtubule affinity-regulating kinase 3 [Quaeritorhiza haematococci]|nr:MAP/microtubule affinity-regulating kinase 3 [Quaeritorhiza haematococci]
MSASTNCDAVRVSVTSRDQYGTHRDASKHYPPRGIPSYSVDTRNPALNPKDSAPAAEAFQYSQNNRVSHYENAGSNHPPITSDVNATNNPPLSTASSTTTLTPEATGSTKQIGDYVLKKTIGQGTFGKVKLAEHVRTKDLAAIKIIEKANVKTQKQKNSVQREVRLMKLLHHPHIVEVKDIIETDEHIFMIMEYASGGELFDYIVSNGMVKEKESRAFFRQILSAVDYCHQVRHVSPDVTLGSGVELYRR